MPRNIQTSVRAKLQSRRNAGGKADTFAMVASVALVFLVYLLLHVAALHDKRIAQMAPTATLVVGVFMLFCLLAGMLHEALLNRSIKQHLRRKLHTRLSELTLLVARTHQSLHNFHSDMLPAYRPYSRETLDALAVMKKLFDALKDRHTQVKLRYDGGKLPDLSEALQILNSNLVLPADVLHNIVGYDNRPVPPIPASKIAEVVHRLAFIIAQELKEKLAA